MKTAHLVVVSLLLTVIATTNADSLSVPLKNYQESVVFTFAYCRDGNFRADFCVDSVLRIYDIRDGKLKKSIKLPFSRLTLFTKSYSPSKQELISGSDSVIYKINIDKGNVSAFPLPRSAAASPLFFLDDYTRMVSCDSVYRLWDLNSGTERRCFADLDTVEFAAFSPDNKSVLLLHKADSSAELRDAVTDSVIMTYHIPGMGFSYAVFSPDGERFQILRFSDIDTLLRSYCRKVYQLFYRKYFRFLLADLSKWQTRHLFVPSYFRTLVLSSCRNAVPSSLFFNKVIRLWSLVCSVCY
jgi:WD40 repeat protein